MKVDVAGLIAAAQRLIALATSVQGVLGRDGDPLAAIPRPVVRRPASTPRPCCCGDRRARRPTACTPRHASGHDRRQVRRSGGDQQGRSHDAAYPGVGPDDAALATLAPVPPITPDVRVPLPPRTPLSRGSLLATGHTGSAAKARASAPPRPTTGSPSTPPRLAVTRRRRDGAGSVGQPDRHRRPCRAGSTNTSPNSPRSPTAGSSSPTRRASMPTTTARRSCGDAEARRVQGERRDRHRPTEYGRRSLAQRGVLDTRAAEASRYAGVTETAPRPTGTGCARRTGRSRRTPAPAREPPLRCGRHRDGWPGPTAGQAGGRKPPRRPVRPGMRRVSWRSCCPPRSARSAVWRAARPAWSVRFPQALMQSGQGLAQAANQGLSGLASKNPTDAELSKTGRRSQTRRAVQRGTAAAERAAVAAVHTHPAGALGPPVIPSTSHTPPTVPAGAARRPTPPPAGGSAMGAMPMGMPMGGMMPHGQGGDGGADKVPADKKVVTPPQPHTEPVTGRVSDRTAAAAEASRTRAESDDPDDDRRHADRSCGESRWRRCRRPMSAART